MHNSERVIIRDSKILSDDWYVLRKTTFDYLRNDGQWQTQSRETYDRGNGATLLLYNLDEHKVILIRQFRFPAFVNGLADGMLVESPAGLLENVEPEQRIKMEVEEETGIRISTPQKIFEAYMSPGSVTEKLFFYIAPYNSTSRTHMGGGIEEEGEDIEVMELAFSRAMEMIGSGEIQDGKTIMLLQYAALRLFGPATW